MLKNYLKIAWRSLKTNRMFSIINIFGLSVGLAVTILLFMFIKNEKSFDSMYVNKKNIHRVLLHTNGNDGVKETWTTQPPAAAPTMMTDIPNVKYAARMLKNDFGGTASVRASEQNFTERSMFWVDAELLKIFEIEFNKGKANGALDRPNTVVISETIAQKYFDDKNPIGETILVDSKYKLEVTGVYKDFAKNSTLDCDIMASTKTMWFYRNKSWNNASFETYCLLNTDTSLTSVESQMQIMLDKHMEKENQWYSFSLQPLEKVHLYSSDYGNSYASKIGDIKEIRNLSYLAILILLIACINYMNLTTARSQKRSKEVGISKTLGASSNSLVARFYAETALVTLISIGLGVVVAILALPLFNQITGQDLTINLIFNIEFAIILISVWLITTLISGSYPAMYLSKFLPKEVLKPSYRQGQSNVFIRKGLVVVQFAASIILIVGVLVIYEQMQFIRNQKLGYNPENVIAISATGIRGEEKTNALVQELKNLNNVSSVSMSQGFPGMEVSGRSLREKPDDEESLNIQTNVADRFIVDVLQLKLLAGQSLPAVKKSADSVIEVVLNKKAIDYLGYTPEEAIGKEVHISVTNTIVGVVDDFNFSSLHTPIGAYAFHNNAGEPKSFALVRYKSEGLSNSMQQFESVFKKVLPNVAFDYTFLDNNLEKLYERERRSSQTGIIFCFLAIFIACLGLFGLAAFMAEQRKKEISVRKVLGASIGNITKLLSQDFVKLVLIALIIAFPISYWLMESWLQNFAYRINISWVIFLIAGISAVVIALCTVSFQSIRAALMNPVKSLRSE